jgi:hypothetical protein
VATVPTTHTVAVGDFATAADENTYVRDPQSFWLNRPRCSVYQGTTATTCAVSGTSYAMNWDTEDYDSDAMHSTSSNTSRIVIATSGLYTVSLSVYFAASATGLRTIDVRKNAAGSGAGGTQIKQFRQGATSSSSGQVSGSFQEYFTAGDYFELFAIQTSGGSLATVLGRQFTFVQALWEAA